MDGFGVVWSRRKAIQDLYQDSEAAARIGEEITDWFEVERGVR